jgi:diguanylate cyclase (GGDEF)-like protein
MRRRRDGVARTSSLCAGDRDRAAHERDERADSHDAESEACDVRADARDSRSEARERATGEIDIVAAADRKAGLRDREGSASDRIQARNDRAAASSDRAFSAIEREVSSIDQLTGVHRRDAGIFELARELDRAKRTNQLFVVAFVDVDNLKATNDTLGHIVGDELLRQVADAIHAHVRSYDLIVRFGGDEFVCGLPDVSVTEAGERFALVNSDLAASRHASISVGLTDLQADDDLQDLIARADKAMYEQRQCPGRASATGTRFGRP